MPGFFDRPDPQQAVPGDLGGIRQSIIDLLMGGRTGPSKSLGGATYQPGRSGGGLEALLGFMNEQTPGGDILGPLGEVFNTRLNDNISQMNASTPGRFSSANLYQQGQLRQRSMQDYNLLASQVLNQGRDRQLQAIMGLLNPVLGPTFGGPFTQGSSGFEHLLGGIGAVAQIPGLGGMLGGGGGPSASRTASGPAEYRGSFSDGAGGSIGYYSDPNLPYGLGR